jgi:hypothetical protein
VAVARPVVVACGDILGVTFDGEEESVLFLPHSGEVVISAVAQWHALSAPSQGLSASELPDQAVAAELRSTLRQLGVKFG